GAGCAASSTGLTRPRKWLIPLLFSCSSQAQLPDVRRFSASSGKLPTMKMLLGSDELRAMARGCAILGAGGGGDPHLGLLQVLHASADYGPVRLVDLDELPDDSLIMPCGGIGAPTVSIEKIENGDEGGRLRHYLEEVTGRTVSALMSSEIGGANGLLPV